MSTTASPTLKHYDDLSWRLEVPIAYRGAAADGYPAPVQPQYIMCLRTRERSRITGEEGIAPSTEEHWFVIDYETAAAITQSLDDALKFMRSQQYRRINRLVK